MKTKIEDAEPLSRDGATAYRRNVARAIYSEQDRTDIKIATKEFSRAVAHQSVGDQKI